MIHDNIDLYAVIEQVRRRYVTTAPSRGNLIA
jgi:hypothetical protein